MDFHPGRGALEPTLVLVCFFLAPLSRNAEAFAYPCCQSKRRLHNGNPEAGAPRSGWQVS
eukprot:3771414-Amphidinium_carterae.1